MVDERRLDRNDMREWRVPCQNDRPRSIGANNGGRTIYRSHLGYSTLAPRVKTCRGSIYRALYAVDCTTRPRATPNETTKCGRSSEGSVQKRVGWFPAMEKFQAHGLRNHQENMWQGGDWFFRNEWYEQQVKFKFSLIIRIDRIDWKFSLFFIMWQKLKKSTDEEEFL